MAPRMAHKSANNVNRPKESKKAEEKKTTTLCTPQPRCNQKTVIILSHTTMVIATPKCKRVHTPNAATDLKTGSSEVVHRAAHLTIAAIEAISASVQQIAARKTFNLGGGSDKRPHLNGTKKVMYRLSPPSKKPMSQSWTLADCLVVGVTPDWLSISCSAL